MRQKEKDTSAVHLRHSPVLYFGLDCSVFIAVIYSPSTADYFHLPLGTILCMKVDNGAVIIYRAVSYALSVLFKLNPNPSFCGRCSLVCRADPSLNWIMFFSPIPCREVFIEYVVIMLSSNPDPERPDGAIAYSHLFKLKIKCMFICHMRLIKQV